MTDSVRIHYQEELEKLEARALDGLDLVAAQLARAVETVEHQDTELAELVCELTGSASDVVHIPRPEDDPTVRRPDITMARAELGWEPRVALAAGLRHTIAWFRELPDAHLAVGSSA